MTSERTNGRDPARKQTRDSESEWAWVAGVYDEIPAPSGETIARVAAATADAVTAARRRSEAARKLRWALGVAAAIALAVVGWRRWALRDASSRIADAGTRAAPAPAAPGAAPSAVPPVRPTPSDTSLASSRSARPEKAQKPAVPAARPAPELAAPPGAAAGSADHSIAPRTDVAAQVPPAKATSGDSMPAAPPAEIPGADDRDLARLHTGLGEEGIRALADLLHGAAATGLPTAPLLDRALAGVAHGASSSVILATVGRRVAALRRAGDALGTGVTAAELTAGADALEGGAGVSELAEIRRRFPRDRATAGLLALAGLVTGGVPAPAAAEALAQGVNAGASDATLLSWRAGVLADVARGVAPLAALQAQVERLDNHGEPPRDGVSPDREVPPARVAPRSAPANLPAAP